MRLLITQKDQNKPQVQNTILDGGSTQLANLLLQYIITPILAKLLSNSTPSCASNACGT